MAEVTAVNVYQARYRVPVARATAGNLVLIEGIDATITKTATLVAEAYDEPVCIFRSVCVFWMKCEVMVTGHQPVGKDQCLEGCHYT